MPGADPDASRRTADADGTLSDAPHERMLAALRDAGGRVTSQRRVVVEELVRLGGHCTAEQLLHASTERMDSIEPSTVYRILEALESAGAVYHVHFGHGAGVWHLTGTDHHHAVCDRCGTVVEVTHEMLEPLRLGLQAAQGFELDTRHFALAGRCRHCAAVG